MNKILAISACLIIFSTNLYSQNTQRTETLKQQLQKATHDTTRSNLLNLIGESYHYTIPDTAYYYFQHAERLCLKNLKKKQPENLKETYIRHRANALNNYGIYWINKGDLTKSKKNYMASLQQYTNLNDKSGMANSWNNIGYIYYNQGNIPQALEYYYKSLKMYETINDKQGMAAGYNNIGSIYIDQQEIQKGLYNFKKSLKASEEINDSNAIASMKNNIAIIYKEKGERLCTGTKEECTKKNLSIALTYMKDVLIIRKKLNDKAGIANSQNNIGMIYLQQGKREEAKKNTLSALQLYQETGIKQGEASVKINLVDIELQEGNIDKALKYALSGYQIATEIGYPDKIKLAAEKLKNIYEQQHNYKQALEMYKIYTQMHDSIYNAENKVVSTKNELQFKYEKQVMQDRLKIKEEQLKHQQAIRIQQTYTNMGIAAFLGMLIIALIYINAYKIKQKAHEVIVLQNKTIEQTNKDLERQHILNQKIFTVITHDIKGTMISLAYMFNSLKGRITDNGTINLIQGIEVEVTNANEILKNLLNWASTEINTNNIKTKTSNVFEIYTKTNNEFKLQLQHKKLKIITDINENSVIKIPPDVLQIVFRNLISNAIKYSWKENTIEVRYEEKSERLSVKDYGIGMSENTSNKLFMKEVDTELGTEKEEGFGVGLYMISELLNKYSYTIQVESQIGKGAEFRVSPVS